MTLIKFDPNGDILWQNTLNGSTGNDVMEFGSLTVDPSDNPIIMFSARLATLIAAGTVATAARNAYVAKYNTNGALVWERGFAQIGDDNSALEQRGDITTDTAGNVYAQFINWQTANAVTLKLASGNGSVIWQELFESWQIVGGVPRIVGNTAEASGVSISSDDSILFRSYSGIEQTGARAMLLKANATTGDIIETRRLDGPGTDVFDRILDVKIDPATDLVYVWGTVDPVSTSYNFNARPYLLCMDLNFNIQYYHEFVLDTSQGGVIYIDFSNSDTNYGRGPRISIGANNLTLGFVWDDGYGVSSVLLNVNKDGSTPAGLLYTNTTPDNSTITLVKTGEPTLTVHPNPSDGYVVNQAEPPLSAVAGAVTDISGDLTVAVTSSNTYGTKAAVSGALAPPAITLI